jgi:hypothetical protein
VNRLRVLPADGPLERVQRIDGADEPHSCSGRWIGSDVAPPRATDPRLCFREIGVISVAESGMITPAAPQVGAEHVPAV